MQTNLSDNPHNTRGSVGVLCHGAQVCHNLPVKHIVVTHHTKYLPVTMGDDHDEVGGWGDECECLEDMAVDQTPLQVMMQTNKECKYGNCNYNLSC